MWTRFDRLAKRIGHAALGCSGATVIHDEISPAPWHADLRHEPDPARKAERKRLGLLGRITSTLCLIEIYSHAPTAEEFRSCLGKHIAFWQQRRRKARADHGKRTRARHRPRPFIAPFLWIIAAGAPTSLMDRLELKPAPGWPSGVYLFGDDVLRVGIVVASELPRTRSTVLVRLMAAGPLLARAVEDLNALPSSAFERSVAEPILLELQSVLGKKPIRTPEEQEFMMIMLKSWDETRLEARTEARAEAVLTVLQARRISVPIAARRRILAEKDLKQLKRWLRKAVSATSIEDVIGSPR